MCPVPLIGKANAMNKLCIGLATCCLLLLTVDSVQAVNRSRASQSNYYRLRFCTPAPKPNCASGPSTCLYQGSAVYSGSRVSPGSAVYSGKFSESAVYSGYAVYWRSDLFRNGSKRSGGKNSNYDAPYGSYYTKALYGDPYFGLVGYSGFIHGGFGIYIGF